MSDDVKCPKCGGRMWDNRETKKNPKAPDYKCRDKSCDGVVWPPRNPANARKGPRPSEPVEYGGPVPGLDDEPDDTTDLMAKAQDGAAWEAKMSKLNALMQGYDLFFDHALVLAKKVEKAGYVVTMEGVNAAAATMAIQASQKGLLG